MTVFGRKALASAALGLAFGWAGAASAACVLQQAAQYHVTMVANRPLIDASINGHPVRLVVDLGGQRTFLTVDAAKTLGLDVVHTSGTVFGVGGSVQAETTQVHDLKMGDSVAHDVDIQVLDARPTPGGAVGMLGRDYLTAMDVEFDLADGAVRLFKPKDCKGEQVVYWSKTFSEASFFRNRLLAGPSIPVSLNGKTVYATINSGAAASLVSEDAARRVGVTPRSEGVEPAGVARGLGPQGKPVPLSVAVFPTLTIGDETVRNAKLKIGNLFEADKREVTGTRILRDPVDWPEMQLGADFLYAHRLYIAWDQGKIYFTYLGGQAFQTRLPNTDGASAQLSAAAP